MLWILNGHYRLQDADDWNWNLIKGLKDDVENIDIVIIIAL